MGGLASLDDMPEESSPQLSRALSDLAGTFEETCIARVGAFDDTSIQVCPSKGDAFNSLVSYSSSQKPPSERPVSSDDELEDEDSSMLQSLKPVVAKPQTQHLNKDERLPAWAVQRLGG